MPRTTVVAIDGDAAQRLAVGVWEAARRATGNPPTDARVRRVHDKVRGGAVGLLAHRGDRAAGMLVAEPYRADGTSDATCGHLSMVFVDPALWGFGVGGAMVRALQRGDHGPGWIRLSVWTRTTNTRAQRLYVARGFTDTGERSTLREGDVIGRWEWCAEA
jgi:GNAT superfamily N-acetyltransferase